MTRSESTSASELAIREELASLQSKFTVYKMAFEKRHFSDSAKLSGTAKSRHQVSPVSPVLLETKAKLKSPSPTAGGVALDRNTLQENLAFVRSKSASLGRRSTIGVMGGKGLASGSSVRVDVKEKVAVFDEKSKDDELPITELGTSFGHQRQRARSAGPVTMHKIMDARRQDQNATAEAKKRRGSESEGQGPESKGHSSEVKMEKVEEGGGEEVGSGGGGELSISVPMRRRGKGMSKAERSRKIEDIKKLFESSELESQFTAAEAGHHWKRKSSVDTEKAKTASLEREAQQVQPQQEKEKSGSFSDAPLSSIPAITVSLPPPHTPGHAPDATPPRGRLNTAPTIIRTVIKEQSPPPTRQQIITISLLDHKEEEEGMAKEKTTPHEEKTSPPPSALKRTRSMSPQSRHRAKVKVEGGSPAIGRKGGWFKGKVSSLRDMFDSQSKGQARPMLGAIPGRGKDKPSNLVTTVTTAPSVPPTKDTSDTTDTILPTTNTVQPTADDATKTADITQSDTADTTESTADKTQSTADSTDTIPDTTDQKDTEEIEAPAPPPSEDDKSADDVSMEGSPRADTPPPRPLPPLGNYDQSTGCAPSSSLDSETDSDSLGSVSDSGSSLLDDADIELVSKRLMEWNEDLVNSTEETTMADGGGLRPLKSLRKVLSDLLTSELSYLGSVDLLSEVYLSHLDMSSHVPSFLKGASTSIFANIRELHTFQRSVQCGRVHHESIAYNVRWDLQIEDTLGPPDSGHTGTSK